MTLPGRCDRKIVVDTNVILFDALAINKFKNADIFIPFSVIEEIDRFKRDPGGKRPQRAPLLALRGCTPQQRFARGGCCA